MGTTLSPKRHDLQAPRALPIIAYFEEDAGARQLLVGAHRFRRMPFDSTLQENPVIERIVMVTSEEVVQKHYGELRVPNVRVLALSKSRFKDARIDGAVYAYLPPDVPKELLERTLDNALDHIHLVQTRHEVNERLAGVTQEIHELNKIGVALSAEHNTRKLMETILTKSREFTRSDAGSIYLVERKLLTRDQQRMAFNNQPPKAQAELFEEQLRFSLAQNDTVNVPFRETTIDINKRSIAGYVALTGEVVNIEDAYHLQPGLPYVINRKFDTDSGYRTKSILAVPMRNQKDKIVGVLQLINAKRDFNARLASLSAVVQQVVPYTARQQEIVLSLASQAAVALENSQLYESIQKLFRGFVDASVKAIEARDPTTKGHSFRVAGLTVALAEAVDRSDAGAYAHTRFSRDQMREIEYASLLHDFGKVGVREEVLVKAKKLYPLQLELIKQRFGFVRRALENEVLQSKIDYVLEKGREEFLQSLPQFNAKLADAVGELDGYLQDIIRSNEPTVLPEGNFERLLGIAAVNYLDCDGERKPLLHEDEVRLLSIRKGSLDDDERHQIELHVKHTFEFLQQIPWTNELSNIPAIARGHHEKLNGAGYPYKLSAPEIPLQTRMMTISDIYDALTASDRPYKKAVSIDRALQILELSVKDGELDPDLFELFKCARIYERLKSLPSGS
ncbi:MAG TPA: HD domain-containing phosphohydrolase [Candidatus Angelobacter sp.]|jgi:HD-GYP domain-containing protein (c-di-GMP phosphodiesterase class II)|nr:HD domain-containing phosphohydrolase [Candidatus Angelobacter sp.]